MKVARGYERARESSAPTSAVALGNFDGVHVGHRELLARAVAKAHDTEMSSVAFTFDPHPAAVLAPDLAPSIISSLARRLELIESMGIDVCVVEPFTAELAALSPSDFFTKILVDGLGCEHIVVGYDFTFGRKRSGTTATLTELGKSAGVTVEIVDPVATRDIVASSTKVRNFIGEGNLSGARLLLGRNYDIDGIIVGGEKRGRELGYPTANVTPDIAIIAPTGIYASWVEILDGEHSGHRAMAATSLGTNPTFGDGRARTLEPHLLDFDDDIYGCRVRVELVEYLRPEQRFSSIDDLVRAIDGDIRKTRQVLGERTVRDPE